MQWMSTVVRARITSGSEMVIISLYQILIRNSVPLHQSPPSPSNI